LLAAEVRAEGETTMKLNNVNVQRVEEKARAA